MRGGQSSGKKSGNCFLRDPWELGRYRAERSVAEIGATFTNGTNVWKGISGRAEEEDGTTSFPN